jgi:hypothetical protein
MKKTVAILLLLLVAGCETSNQNEKDKETTPNPQSNLSAQTADRPAHGERNTTPGQATREIKIPDAPVSGTIAQRPFKPDTIQWGSSLVLQQGDDTFPDMALTISEFLEEDETVAGKTLTWTVSDFHDIENPFVRLNFKENAKSILSKTEFIDTYTLQLQFGEIGDNGQVAGKIFFETRDGPGAKVAGNFTVMIPDNSSQQPQAWYRPWVVTRIQLPDQEEHKLKVGYDGKTTEGQWKSNMVGTTIQAGEDSVASSLSFKPQVTTLASTGKLGAHGRHLRLSPGKYLFYVTENSRYIAWKTVEVTADTAEELTFQLDTADAGMLTVEVANTKENEWVHLTPLTEAGQPPLDFADPLDLRRLIDSGKVENGRAHFESLAPGRYRVHLSRRVPIDKDSSRIYWSKRSLKTEIVARKEATIKIEYID